MSKSDLNNFSQWIYPLMFGVTAYFFVRIVTDIPLHNAVAPANHLVGILWALFLSYSLYFAYRYYFSRNWKRNHKGVKLLREYTEVVLFLLIITNASILISNLFTPTIDLTDDHPAGGIVIVNTISLAFSLLYYTLIRSQWISMNQEIQLEKIKRDQVNTELDLLKAQYHPHFLFNALNTIYFQINDDNPLARYSVELLSRLLRYQLYDISHKVSFAKELEYLQSYIQFQSLRTSERLQLTFDVSPQLRDQQIHPLLFQPLIENAFKYLGGDYRIDISFGLEKQMLYSTIQNSISKQEESKQKKSSGIGIRNLQRRLELLYPQRYSLHTQSDNDTFIVELSLKIG